MRILLSAAVVSALIVGPAAAKDKDIFNYVAQKKAGKDVKKIVFIADTGRTAAAATTSSWPAPSTWPAPLNADYPNAYAVVYHQATSGPRTSSTPTRSSSCSTTAARRSTRPSRRPCERGAGFMAIHYGVEVNKGKQGDNYLKWIGGYFETVLVGQSVLDRRSSTRSPSTRRRAASSRSRSTTSGTTTCASSTDMKGVTPILSAVPPVEDGQQALGRQEARLARRQPGRAATTVKAGKPQHWPGPTSVPTAAAASASPATTSYDNLANDSFRTLLLNAVAWTAKLEVPSGGIPTKTPTKEELGKLLEDGERIPN